ncbi:unnamed protein product, partial [Protopolystoma xenopodis]
MVHCIFQIAVATIFHNLAYLSYMLHQSSTSAIQVLARTMPRAHLLPVLCLRVCLGQLFAATQSPVGSDSSVTYVTRVHPEAAFRLLVSLGTALSMLNDQVAADTSAQSIKQIQKAHVARLLACAYSAIVSTLNGSSSDSNKNLDTESTEQEAEHFEKARGIIEIWAKS